MNKQTTRVDFVDWMKALAMLLIVFGHFFGDPYNQLTQPVYPKQLGVVAFVFIMGWGLGKANHARWHVAFKRIFPMFFWGGVVAIIISVVSLIAVNDLRLSNYMPFVFGLNVGFNFFPNNPTSWFIGTYLHLVLLWAAVFYRIKITFSILCASLLFEIGLRALLIHVNQVFVAYMLFPNWLTIFLLGIYFKDIKDSPRDSSVFPYVIGWITFTGLWALLLNSIEVGRRFPFQHINIASDLISTCIESIFVSILYMAHCYFFVTVFSRIKANNIVRFFSRNTIIVFIGHMPFYAVAAPIASIFVASGWGKRLIIVLLMYGVLSLISEWLTKVVDIGKLQNRLWQKLSGYISDR